MAVASKVRQVTYQTETGTSTWYFDPEKSGNGPYKVENNYNKEFWDYFKAPKVKKQKNK